MFFNTREKYREGLVNLRMYTCAWPPFLPRYVEMVAGNVCNPYDQAFSVFLKCVENMRRSGYKAR